MLKVPPPELADLRTDLLIAQSNLAKLRKEVKDLTEIADMNIKMRQTAEEQVATLVARDIEYNGAFAEIRKLVNEGASVEALRQKVASYE